MTTETALARLDALCATEIMGFDYSSDDEHHGIWSGSDNCYLEPGDWQPTRNIAQAWEVLEKFDADVNIIKRKDSVGKQAGFGSWTCQIKLGVGWYHGLGHTAPEAIVCACLMAKGVDIE